MVRKGKSRYAMSRYRKRMYLAVFFACLVILSILDHQFGTLIRLALSHYGSNWGDYHKYHGHTFHVIHVVDGDTFDIRVSDDQFPTTRVRLLGVDTPEKGEERGQGMFFGAEATQFTSSLVLDRDVTILIDTVGDVRGKYGRLLAYVVLPDGRVLNEHIIRLGYGYADTRFTHSQYENYLDLQKQAFTEKTGLWAQVTIDQLPRWFQRVKPNFLR